MIFPNDANGDALRRLERDGDDLTRARDIDFAVALPDEAAAEGFADYFRHLGYEVSAEKTHTQPELPWDVVVVKNMVPSHNGITEFEDLLQSIASGFRGRNDGWGCFTGGGPDPGMQVRDPERNSP
jgi:hypothetical protein